MKRETLFFNGKIYTSDKENPFVSAMLVREGFVIWTGTTKEAEEKLNADIEAVDLGGRVVVPGFIDAHMHPVMLAEFSEQIACLPPEINSIKELSEKIKAVADSDPQKEWILGWGYDEGKFLEQRSPNRYDLDAGCKDRPVSIIRSCEHIRCVNSKALELAGIDENTPDPEGGEIERDERGIPTGVLKESARNLVLPFMPKETTAEVVESLINLGKLLDSKGIVAIADMGNLKEGENYELYTQAMKKGFKQRVAMYYMLEFFKEGESLKLLKERLANKGDASSRLKLAGVKLIGDGSVSGQTAWVYEPYKNNTVGIAVYPDEEMELAIELAKEYGCQISIHAMGGRAIDRALDRVKQEDFLKVEDALKPEGSVRVRIEHVTEPTLEAMKTAKEHNIAFVTQPIFMYCEIESYQKNMQMERIKKAYPVKTMLDQGVSLALSTDAPATSWADPSDPFSNIKAAVTRVSYNGIDLGSEQAVDVETAIRLYTIEAAKVMGLSQIGMLKPGYLADFAVLSQDIFAIDKAQIDEIYVEATYVEGEKIYER